MESRSRCLLGDRDSLRMQEHTRNACLGKPVTRHLRQSAVGRCMYTVCACAYVCAYRVCVCACMCAAYALTLLVGLEVLLELWPQVGDGLHVRQFGVKRGRWHTVHLQGSKKATHNFAKRCETCELGDVRTW